MSNLIQTVKLSGRVIDGDLDYSDPVKVSKTFTNLNRSHYTGCGSGYVTEDFAIHGEKKFGHTSYSGLGLPSWLTGAYQHTGDVFIANKSSRFGLSVLLDGNDGKVLVPGGEFVMFRYYLDPAPTGDAITLKGVGGDVLVEFLVYFHWVMLS